MVFKDKVGDDGVVGDVVATTSFAVATDAAPRLFSPLSRTREFVAVISDGDDDAADVTASSSSS